MARSILGVVLALAACAADGRMVGSDDDDESVARVDSQPGGVTGPGACVMTHEQVVTASNGDVTTSRWFNVEVDAADDQDVWAMACSYDQNGATPFACPAGSTCTGEPFPYYSGCEAIAGSRIVDGTRLLFCGYEYTATGSSPSQGGGHWTDVTVHID